MHPGESGSSHHMMAMVAQLADLDIAGFLAEYAVLTGVKFH